MTLASKITLVRVAFIPLYMVFMYQSGGQAGPKSFVNVKQVGCKVMDVKLGTSTDE